MTNIENNKLDIDKSLGKLDINNIQEIRKELIADITKAKKSTVFSEDEIKTIVDVGDDGLNSTNEEEAMIEISKAEVKSHFETLEDLGTQVDFLLDLLDLTTGGTPMNNVSNAAGDKTRESLDQANDFTAKALNNKKGVSKGEKSYNAAELAEQEAMNAADYIDEYYSDIITQLEENFLTTGENLTNEQVKSYMDLLQDISLSELKEQVGDKAYIIEQLENSPAFKNNERLQAFNSLREVENDLSELASFKYGSIEHKNKQIEILNTMRNSEIFSQSQGVLELMGFALDPSLLFDESDIKLDENINQETIKGLSAMLSGNIPENYTEEEVKEFENLIKSKFDLYVLKIFLELVTPPDKYEYVFKAIDSYNNGNYKIPEADGKNYDLVKNYTPIKKIDLVVSMKNDYSDIRSKLNEDNIEPYKEKLKGRLNISELNISEEIINSIVNTIDLSNDTNSIVSDISSIIFSNNNSIENKTIAFKKISETILDVKVENIEKKQNIVFENNKNLVVSTTLTDILGFDPNINSNPSDKSQLLQSLYNSFVIKDIYNSDGEINIRSQIADWEQNEKALGLNYNNILNKASGFNGQDFSKIEFTPTDSLSKGKINKINWENKTSFTISSLNIIESKLSDVKNNPNLTENDRTYIDNLLELIQQEKEIAKIDEKMSNSWDYFQNYIPESYKGEILKNKDTNTLQNQFSNINDTISKPLLQTTSNGEYMFIYEGEGGTKKQVEISSQEAQLLKTPEAQKNYINLYGEIQKLGLPSLWNYRKEIMTAMDDMSVNAFDGQGLEAGELMKFKKYILEISTGTKLKDNANAQDIDQKLRNWAAGGNELIATQKENILGDDRFLQIMKTFDIIDVETGMMNISKLKNKYQNLK